MPAPDAEKFFLAHLDRIERIIASIARRHALGGDDADDFASWVKARLIKDEYRILRKFQRRSSIPTFLAVVIGNLFRDYRVQQWGRWRPSAAAKRMGAVAMRLEALLHREGHTLAQAIEMLRSRGVTGPSDRELSELASRLPDRVRRNEAHDDVLALLAADQGADRALWQSEQTSEWEAVRGALERALRHLPAEDQLILQVRFWDGFSVAEIARLLHLEQKPLYRRLDGDLARLRALLEVEGVHRADVAALLSGGL